MCPQRYLALTGVYTNKAPGRRGLPLQLPRDGGWYYLIERMVDVLAQ